MRIFNNYFNFNFFNHQTKNLKLTGPLFAASTINFRSFCYEILRNFTFHDQYPETYL